MQNIQSLKETLLSAAGGFQNHQGVSSLAVERAKNLKSVQGGSYGLRWSMSSSFFPSHWSKPRDMTVASLEQPLPRDNRGEVLEKDNLFGIECKSLEMLKYKVVE